MNKYVLLVVGMALVTYLPRVLPLVMFSELKLPPLVQAFFRYIPYAALGALIFPGVLTSTGNYASAAAGCIVAMGLAFRRVNLVLVVAGGVLGVLLWEALLL